MKTILLLFTGMLLSTHTEAADNPFLKDNILDHSKHYRIAEPISFVQRGIEFFIFPDGSFDFNTHYNDMFLNNSRRSNINASYNGPRMQINHSSSEQPERILFVIEMAL
jgi:hypothetical protein